MIGRLSSDPFIETIKNGKAKALFAEVALPNKDIRTVQIFPGPGEESWPCKGDVVIVERVGGLLFATAIWDGEEPTLKPGEREFYSRNAKRKRVASTHMDSDGNIITKADKNITTEIDGNLKTNTKGNEALFADGNYTRNVKGSSTTEVSGTVIYKGATINLN